MQAIFVKGNYETVDYTPSGAVAAGDIIVLGAKCYIAHHPIEAGVQGALAARGGIYRILATGGSSGDVIAMGDKVYWDDSNNNAEESATSNTPLGWAAADKAAADTTMLVEHGAW